MKYKQSDKSADYLLLQADKEGTMDEVKIILPPGGNGKLHILAAVSGGADSVALLYALHK